MITNKKTGQKYIGQSVSIEQRWTKHTRNTSNKRLKKAIEKYGIASFSLEILEVVEKDIDILNEREMYFISKYNTYEDEFHYNETKGGKNLSLSTMSEEGRKRVGEASKRRWKNPEYREKMIKILKNVSHDNYPPWSEERKKQKSEQMKLYHKLGLLPTRKGTKTSKEGCKNISIGLSKSKNKLGIYRVHIRRCGDYKQGFCYRYSFRENGREYAIDSSKLGNLKKKVLSKGWDWKIIDKDKYNHFLKSEECVW